MKPSQSLAAYFFEFRFDFAQGYQGFANRPNRFIQMMHVGKSIVSS